jgi:heme exporter protein C
VCKTAYRWFPLLIGATALSMIGSLYLVFVYAPTEQMMGFVQRIFYFHVPAAWVGFLAFGVAFIAAMTFLVRRELGWDMLQIASVEIGILFSTMALVSGSLWARPVWNTWWTWDPRLTTTLVMWLYYVSTLLLRRIVEGEERRARFAAMLNVIGFINVPLVFLAIRLWRTIHPVLFTTQGFAMETSMLLTLAASLLAFTLLFACLLVIRMRLERLNNEIGRLKQSLTLLANEQRGVP